MKLSNFEKYTIILFLVTIFVFIFLNIDMESKTKRVDIPINEITIIDSTKVNFDSTSNKRKENVKAENKKLNSVNTSSIDSISDNSSLQNYLEGHWESQNFTVDFLKNGVLLILVNGGEKSIFGEWKIENDYLLLKYSVNDKLFERYELYNINENFMIFGYDKEGISKRYKFEKINNKNQNK